MGIVAGNGIVVYRCSSGKLVAPGIYHGSTTGDDDRWEMILHTVTIGERVGRGICGFIGRDVRRGSGGRFLAGGRNSGLGVVVGIHGDGGQGGEMEEPMAVYYEVVGISSANGKLIETDGHAFHLRFRPVEARPNHPAAGAALLHIALAEGGRE